MVFFTKKIIAKCILDLGLERELKALCSNSYVKNEAFKIYENELTFHEYNDTNNDYENNCFLQEIKDYLITKKGRQEIRELGDEIKKMYIFYIGTDVF